MNWVLENGFNLDRLEKMRDIYVSICVLMILRINVL